MIASGADAGCFGSARAVTLTPHSSRSFVKLFSAALFSKKPGLPPPAGTARGAGGAEAGGRAASFLLAVEGSPQNQRAHSAE